MGEMGMEIREAKSNPGIAPRQLPHSSESTMENLRVQIHKVEHDIAVCQHPGERAILKLKEQLLHKQGEQIRELEFLKAISTGNNSTLAAASATLD